MIHPTETDLQRTRLMVAFMRTDPELIAKMEKSNEVSVSEGQVAHGWDHANDVRNLLLYVVHLVNRLIPGTFNEFDELVGEASAFLHDSGRSVAVKDHDKHGAVIAHHYLRALARQLFGSEDDCPVAFRMRVVQNVCKHRSDSWLYKSEEEKQRRKRELTNPAMSALLIADKLCGSEARVDHAKLAFMNQLAKTKLPRGFRKKHKLDRKWTLARINWNNLDLITEPAELVAVARKILAQNQISLDGIEIDGHDRVNGSIKDRQIEMFMDRDSSHPKIKGTMLYRLKVDERLAPQDLVVNLDWWSDAFHTAAKAAKHLGYRFEIDFNGRMLQYDRAQKSWVSVPTIHV